MSSPLSVLRKYQLPFFVFFGVVCMLVFVVGEPLDTWLRSRSTPAGRNENSVVVRWDGGEFRENELGYAQSVRNVIREFLQTLQMETQKKNGQSRVRGISLTPSEEDIVYTQIFAQRAEKMGMAISDEAALSYLEQLTANLIPRATIGQIFRDTVGGRITEQQLLGEIKTALLAENYLSLTYPDLSSSQLPSKAWEYHLRLHRHIKAEVLPVAVADFKDKVKKQPSEAEIAALYAEGKDRYPEPTSPLPGFKRHRRVAFDFVKADRKKFEDEETAKLKSQVTDAEIQDFYEKNKETYRVPATPPATPAAPAATTPPPAESPATPSTTKEDSDAKSDEKSKDAEKKAAAPEEKKSDAEKKDAEKSDAAKESDAPARPESTKSEPAPEEKKGDGKEGDGKESDASQPKEPSTSDVKSEEGKEPSSCGQEETKDAESRASEDGPAAASTKASESNEQDQKDKKDEKAEAGKDDNAPSADAVKKDDAPKSDPTAQPANPPAATPSDATPPAAPAGSAGSGGPSAGAAGPSEVQYQPLDDKLKDEIRERIARQKAAQNAQQRIEKGFSEIRRAIEKYSRDRRSAELNERPAPAKPDIAKLAENHGMTAGSIPLSGPKEVQETELGKTRGFDFATMSFDPIPFHVLAYREGIALFAPDQIRGSTADGNPDAEFLYWKTEEKEPFVPELKDVRDEVVDAWKMREALPLAQEEAKRLAGTVKESGKSMKETFADKETLKPAETNQFAWMTRGFLPAHMGGGPTLSSVDNVEMAGEDFMRSVFDLKVGEAGTAVNQPKTIVYVVRVQSEFPTEEMLREQFLQSGGSEDVQQIAAFDRVELQQTWFEALRRDMNLKWERTPQS